MKLCNFHARDEQDTDCLGAALAALLADGTVVALVGTLGAGKTRLVQAVADASGIDPRDVVSPTFVVIHEYRGHRPIYHFDAYRMKDDDEFLQLGPEEYFEGQGVTFVEWADRVELCLPQNYVQIEISIGETTARNFVICAVGTGFDDLVAKIDATLNKCS